MSNLKKWIKEDLEKDEQVEAVVIGQMGWKDYGKKGVPDYDKQIKNKVLSWDEAKKMIDYEFDSEFCYPGCNAIYVWTNKRIGLIIQYDGATSLHWIPRNPIDIEPKMPGG